MCYVSWVVGIGQFAFRNNLKALSVQWVHWKRWISAILPFKLRIFNLGIKLFLTLKLDTHTHTQLFTQFETKRRSKHVQKIDLRELVHSFFIFFISDNKNPKWNSNPQSMLMMNTNRAYLIHEFCCFWNFYIVNYYFAKWRCWMKQLLITNLNCQQAIQSLPWHYRTSEVVVDKQMNSIYIFKIFWMSCF